MRVHFIAIGGSAMHNMAIALHKKGFQVSGSDDEIFEPSKSRLAKYHLLPKTEGWNPELINDSIDAIILGMHAKIDNPELLRAQELGLKVYSYPEYVYEQSKDKKRVVIGGSHGKTSITSMILHVLMDQKIAFDYLVGAQLDGFETMVQLSDAPLIILEGDEYLSSPIDRRPKFLWYKPHIAVLSGVAWDHINVFPTFENYVAQFQLFTDSIEANGLLTYFHGDEELVKIANQTQGIEVKPYTTPTHKIEDGITFIGTNLGWVPLEIFGDHNLQNLMAAKNVCDALGIDEADFYKAIQGFSGAAKRLEKIAANESTTVFKDFAHSPSKLKATTSAVKKQFAARELIACMELHTFSSLNKEFLKQYTGSMSAADEALVYFNPKTLEHKGLPAISAQEVEAAFLPSKVKVFNVSDEIADYLKSKDWNNKVLLLMTSGNFDGIDLNAFGKSLVG
ncbi:MAG: peptidoglycan synthetase [Bacteroidetes bacterium]|nr:MAG: peptidoglycan synthetase [Bacteroidota bacterium]MBL1144220.1 peptidoglycan synthetase [Bacteroidota bacterium]NOG57016.1 peptidoglycan synthetase [Bacteroidota bacterium]